MGNAPAEMGILRQAALNMVRTVQQNLSSFASIGLLRDRIGPPALDPGLQSALNPTCNCSGTPVRVA